ncbi:DUF397 domain-containing protein [Sphaerisporangium sp. TRM90804]|uniref:DUF397 domain-containing protein n=1 Tax=Sphaerisporangium sp. TRM90804 TaxID=3031113 RepID=UPI003263C08E
MWRTSTYSGGNGNCVEIADLPGGMVAVRDSKITDGPVLRCERAAWVACLGAIKSGTVG